MNPIVSFVVFSEFEGLPKFARVDGDWSRFDGVIINSCEKEDLQDELTALLYDQEGNRKIEWKDAFDLANDLPSSLAGVKLVNIGFYP